ncbi:hypothetical protein FA13DRAFT_1008763 [Coprinellus micaceus]|uniref:Uncharacterized protein n=1 Tax=Coprinellus micaceus TaxID=71717 RepID=A0A4Y7SXY9_COPMI|nr:hypothetical protein FA13DRAFT_1008763 [Coprinellus micaceus]
MLDSEDRENTGIGSTPAGLRSEDVVAFSTPSFSGFAFEVDFKRPCILGLSQSPNVPAGTPIPRPTRKTYDLHSLLQLSDVTSSPTLSPLKESNYLSDSSIRLHRELFDRRSSSPEGLTANDRRWLISDSDSEFDSASEINVVALDATGHVPRIGRIPLDTSHPALNRVEFEVVPLPTDLRGRLQKLERRAKVEVLHDIRPQRERTEQEEFVAWMNKDGVRMLLTPASHASLKAWLDAADESGGLQRASSNTQIAQIAALSPVEFRICVEEDSDIEGQEKVPVPNAASDQYAPLWTFSALGCATVDDDSEDDGNDADVEN